MHGVLVSFIPANLCPVQLVEAKMERRLAEAEVQGETASEFRQQVCV